jgi:hypothetical protein
MKNSMQTAALALLMAAVATSVAMHSIDGEFSKLILWKHIFFLIMIFRTMGIDIF